MTYVTVSFGCGRAQLRDDGWFRFTKGPHDSAYFRLADLFTLWSFPPYWYGVEVIS